MGSCPPATNLIYEARPSGSPEFDSESDGECCFCGSEGDGLSTEEAISWDYFTDCDLMESETGHVCTACAYCMSHKSLKSGHWIATPNTYESPSTGDLPELFESLRRGEYETPLAVHVSENPIRSEHAYLWTPTNEDTQPLTITYSRQQARVDFDVLETLVRAVEDLRLHGFLLDDIRSGEPCVSDVSSIGRETFRIVDAVIEPHRGTTLLEVAITLSQSASDQGREGGVDVSYYSDNE